MYRESLLGIPDQASIFEDWTHIFHILGTRKQISPKDPQGSVGLSANIDDMGILFQIICNCYSEVFDTFNIFQNCTFKSVRSLDFMC